MERIQQIPGVSPTIIMMLTPAGHHGEAERCGRLGVSAYVLKPIRNSELRAAILLALGCGETFSTHELLTQHDPQEHLRKLRILLAEDNAINQAVVVTMLKKMGHETTVACNGRDACAALEKASYDLVFMDVQMPEVDGLAATRKIREHEKETAAHIPIIAMTAHAMKGDKERCLQAGMDDYLTKPVSSAQMEETMARVLGIAQRGASAPEQPQVPQEHAGWDRATALRRVEGDETLLSELLEIFLEETPVQLNSLQQALVAADFEAVERTAHTLKGELIYLGLTEIAERAKALEYQGRERNLQAVAELFPDFRVQLLATASAIREDRSCPTGSKTT